MQVTLTLDPEFDQLYNNYALDPIRESFLRMDGIHRSQLDLGAMSKNYLRDDLPSISIDANSNSNEAKSINGYSSEVVKGQMKIVAYYLLWKYAKERYGLRVANKLIRSNIDGNIYFHDITLINLPYCYAFSTLPIMAEGLPFGQLISGPPKRADSFIGQVIEFSIQSANSSLAGALALSDLITNYCYYAQKEDLSDNEIKNHFQRFVHIVNQKLRTNYQSPFINISIFDKPALEKLFADFMYPDGSKVDYDYVMKVQKIFVDFFCKGDPMTGTPYRFPVCTMNISTDDEFNILDEEFFDWAMESNVELGCFNIYASKGTKLASCCRLMNDFRQMGVKFNSTFSNGGLSLGSSRVCTIGLPRIGILANNKEEYLKILDKRLEESKKLILIHREEILPRRINGKLLQFFDPMGWFSMDNMFCTIGIVGMWESIKFMGMDISEEAGYKFAEEILAHIEKRLDEFTEETGHQWNLEQVPAESAAVSLAKKDSLLFSKGDEGFPFALYSNQFIPLTEPVSMLERMRINGAFMDKMSGGSIMHINVADKIQNKEQMKKIVMTAVHKGNSHIAVNYNYALCNAGHVTIAGEIKTCPTCGEPITDYMTRIVGYFVKRSAWNPARRNIEAPARVFEKYSDIIKEATEA